ncbi:MAG: sialidase family protein, partial [Planctomycetota bacterium]
LTPGSTEVAKDHVCCGGETVDGLYVVTPQAMGRANWARFMTAKSALGDCEFKVVFSCAADRPKWVYPNIVIANRGTLCFWKPGSPIILNISKTALPLKGFSAPTEKNPFDGNLHSMAVKRVGDKISFYYDDKKLNEQPIDPDVNLHLWFDALFATAKIKSIKLTAAELSDNLKTAFKSAAPIQEILVGEGSNTFKKAVYGRAASYRIPALAVSKKGTILAFAEARRVSGSDIGNTDAVVKRSEDNGKTWGPEIVIFDDGGHSICNPSAVVDPKTGRIWLWMGRWAPYPNVSQHVSYSDDDGKTWSKSKEMTQILRSQIKDGRRLVIPGPGSGIALTRGKYAGRLVIPMNHNAGGWAPSVVYSDDSGKTWKPGGALRQNIGESKCAELIDGSVLFVGNPGGRERRRRLTIITDGGTKNATKLWHAEDIKHAGCQTAVERHSWPKDGKPGILLYSGPGVLGARAQGTLRASYDEGKTWPWKKQYYQGGSGYSDIAVLADGRVAVLFEKDGKSKLGFTILPAPPATPPAK